MWQELLLCRVCYFSKNSIPPSWYDARLLEAQTVQASAAGHEPASAEAELEEKHARSKDGDPLRRSCPPLLRLAERHHRA